MGSMKTRGIRRLFCGAAAVVLLSASGVAHAQEQRAFEIPAQPLVSALYQFGEQSGRQVLFKPSLADNKTSSSVAGAADQGVALAQLLEGTGLTFRRSGDVYLIEDSRDPQSGSAAGDGAEVDALIVTAQKREEDIQDVPIAISAFTQESLEQQKIEGGFDLLKAIPNVTFSKNNFTSYNFSIRGIGTKAVSATTDPGVAVSFNNIALLQNRLFEQEYFDVERVEVLRGPQGTLYGRNATAGVINVISAKTDLDDFAGWVKGEVGNYDSKRLSAMVNVPLVEDKLAVRLAGALTDRKGYDFNSVTGHAVNGRSLWSARLTVGFEPTERLRGNFIWERFEEDDDRSRTGKQLCHRDNGPTTIGSTSVTGSGDRFDIVMRPSMFSQGCKAGSLYDDQAFGTPNGLALPFVFAMVALTGDAGDCCIPTYGIGYEKNSFRAIGLIDTKDPYAGAMQSRDLRTIASFRDPIYRANADIFALNLDYDLTDSITIFSQTAYNEDSVYSFQDYNRFNTQPIFNDTSNMYEINSDVPAETWADMAPGGQFCDPQLGCSNTLAGFDISSGEATQFTQELRVQSNFEGPVNFSAGANYTKFDAEVDYYVMYNVITAFAMMQPFNMGTDITKCSYGLNFFALSIPPVNIADDIRYACPYIDPNPVEKISGEGHNYYRSRNPYELSSWAAFGELYWELSDALKVTAGLRYTDDRKTFTPVPSQVLLAPGIAGGVVNRGYPELPDIKQHWGEWTGRLGVDWKPELGFTDDTMVYAFYSRGYKGGGANPPSIGYASLAQFHEQLETGGYGDFKDFFTSAPLELTAVNYGPTFRPEFVNALEFGAKNTLLQGALMLNATAFYYDYTDYQVSKIVDRTAVNENFDATVWGLEFEAVFRPTRNFGLNANLGYLDTSIDKGASIDLMNRTQSNPDWVLVKPWAQLPSNCIVPRSIAESYLTDNPFAVVGWWGLCGGWTAISSGYQGIDPNTGETYDPMTYPEINGGAGFAQNLKGNELPNSPHWTANLGAQYGFEFREGWKATVRADAYWQSQSWARVYNAVNDKLHGWYNANLSLWVENDDGLKIELYAKNILDKTPITDAFMNSDDTALTTNVFVLDPRLIGLSIRKEF